MRDALRRDLEAGLDGEVRFDEISCALYSTDASVYQIVPLGVVIVRSRADIIKTIECARQHGCSITARGGGTSQAGQAIGEGLQLDTSKYFNRLLEVNVGCFRHQVLLRRDKTIDHVLDLHLALADGSVAHLKGLDGDALDAVTAADTLEGACYRTVRRLGTELAAEIDRRYPKILRRVGGYNLDAFTESNDQQACNLAKLVVGSEGTLGIVVEARLNLVPLPAAKAVMTIEFDDLLDALGATPGILEHAPSAVEVMDRHILDHARENPALDELRRQVLRGNPGALLCVEFHADDPADLPGKLDALERDLAIRAPGARTVWATSASAQARIWQLREASLGLSMAIKGDAKSLSFVEDTAVAPERLRDFIERFLEIVRGRCFRNQLLVSCR